MKFALLSDLHLEFKEYDAPLPDADVLILAGDIISGLVNSRDSSNFFDRCYEKYGVTNVFFIEGNHEGYSTSWGKMMHPRICEVRGDTVFIGATLWSGEGSKLAFTVMNDLMLIEGFTWDKMFEEHKKDEEWIRSNLDQYHLTHKCVVFTHHLPSLDCIDKKYHISSNATMNNAFYVDEDELIYKYNPTIWCFGHSHSSTDMRIGETRMISNPRGYDQGFGNENKRFNPGLVIEV